MPEESSQDVTQLLNRWSEGDAEALEALTPIIYSELHKIARRYMGRERAGHTLQTTALVNEAYVRLIDWKNAKFENRAHFFGVSAQLMRRILVDFARRRRYQKRGGDWQKVTLAEGFDVATNVNNDLMVVDEALHELATLDPRKARVVELRFFAGLSLEETAEALNVSTDTVGRDWRAAKAWLTRELRR